MADNTDLIIKLRAETKQLSKDLKKAKRQMAVFNKNMNAIGRNIRNTMLGAFGGAAILSGIKKAVGSLADFEKIMTKVKAISGATAEEFKSLQQNALNLGRASKFTATEIGQLQLELSKLGFTPDKITASTDAIRKLATVADEDLAESAKVMAGTLNSFNMSAAESERVSNIMAESFSKSALTLEKFQVATANSGAIANTFGVTLEENTARLAALVDANIDASKAGTDLRKIMLDLNEKGISYSEALDMVANASDKAGKAQELVGDRAAGALVILSQQAGKVNDLTAELSDSNKELNDMVDIMEDNLITDWQKFQSAIDGVIQRGTPLTNFLRGVVQDLTKLVNSTIPEEMRATDSAFKAWSKTLQKMPDTEETLGFLGKAIGNVRGELSQTEAAMKLFLAESKNVDDEWVESEGSVSELEKRLQEYKNTIGDLEGKLSALLTREAGLTAQLKNQAEALSKARTELTLWQAELGKLGMQSIAAPGISGGVNDFGHTVTTGMLFNQEMMANIRKQQEKYFKSYQETYARIIAITEDFNHLLRDLTIEGITTLAAGIGSALAGGGNPFKPLMILLGDGLIMIGKYMISYSKVVEGIKASFLAGLAGGPGALAVGFAAVAAGAAIKQAASNMATGGGGGVASSGGGGSGGFAFDPRSQAVNVSGEFMVSGRDLLLVLNNQSEFNSRNTIG